MTRAPRHVCIVGAGIGGLAAAMVLAGRGVEVTVLEGAATLGGKARFVPAGAGVTLRPVFEALFAAAGGTLPAMQRQALLGRFRWADGALLELVDGVAANADAVGRFGGSAAARGYQDYAARGQRYFEALQRPFIDAQRPGRLELLGNFSLARKLGLPALSPLWDALGEHFPDPRLRQVFARSACYVGASPLLAPATLMMIGHVEQLGVWRPAGGVAGLLAAMAEAAVAAGASIRTGATVTGLRVEGGRARAALLGSEPIAADAIIANTDVASIAAGTLGHAAARAVPPLPAHRRSFSVIRFGVRRGPDQTLFLPDDPTAEFTALQHRHRLAAQPSLQVSGDAALIMAPARADTRPLGADAIAQAADAALALTQGSVDFDDTAPLTPHDFAAPGTGGALYGEALHGWNASFSRPAARTALPGFFLCGGGTHPGAGLAMAAISGRLAAEAVLA